MPIEGFTPSNKYLFLSREFYNEIKDDLLRIKTSMTADEARAHAAWLLQKLQDKFEKPKYNIQKVLTVHEQAVKNSGKELEVLADDGKDKK